MKKIVRLTESDLTRLVKRVVSEQRAMGQQLTIQNAKTNFPNAKGKTFRVVEVKGKPSITKNGRDLLLTKGMTITPTDPLKFNQGDNVTISSISPEDKGKYFQTVSLNLNQNGKLNLFVYSD